MGLNETAFQCVYCGEGHCNLSPPLLHLFHTLCRRCASIAGPMLEELLRSRVGSAAKQQQVSPPEPPASAEARCGPALITLGDRDDTACRQSVDRWGGWGPPAYVVVPL